MKKYFIIILFIFYSINLFCIEIDPYDLLNIVKNIENRVNILKGLNTDKKLENIIKSLKNNIDNVLEKDKKINLNDKNIISDIELLEKRIIELNFFNNDDDLSILVKYLMLKVDNLKKSEYKIEELTNEVNNDKIISYLIGKITSLEIDLEKLKVEKLKNEEELIKKLEDSSKTNLSKNSDEELLKLIEEIKNNENKLKEELDKLNKNISENENKLKEELNKINKDINKITSENKLKEELNKINKDINEIDGVNENETKLKEEFDKMVKNINENENKLKEELDKLNKNINENETKLKEELDKLNKNINENETKDDKEIKEKSEEKEKKIFASPIHDEQYGNNFAFQFNFSLIGIYTSIGLGIMLPRMVNVCSMGLFANFSISTPGTYVSDKYRTFIPTGSFYITFSTPMFINFIRVYIGGDVHFGSIFALTQIYTEKKERIFPYNLTFGVYGLGGIEFYMTKWLVFFIEAGGGLMYSIKIEDTDPDDPDDLLLINALKANNNNGTGIRLNFGVRFFLVKWDKKDSIF